jgi:hypothetical protein
MILRRLMNRIPAHVQLQFLAGLALSLLVQELAAAHWAREDAVAVRDDVTESLHSLRLRVWALEHAEDQADAQTKS